MAEISNNAAQTLRSGQRYKKIEKESRRTGEEKLGRPEK